MGNRHKKFTKTNPVVVKTKEVDAEFIAEINEDSNAQLSKVKGAPKLFIPAKVWAQLQTLLLKYHTTEWSGILYFTDNEAKNPDELVIKAEFFLPRTIGVTTYTSFDWKLLL